MSLFVLISIRVTILILAMFLKKFWNKGKMPEYRHKKQYSGIKSLFICQNLQQGTAPFDNEEYKRSLFNRIQSKFRSHIFYCFLFIHLFITSDISSLIQMDLCRISGGQTAWPLLTQAYVALGFFAVICQKGYLMITGVL